jgi:hypothetical protein
MAQVLGLITVTFMGTKIDVEKGGTAKLGGLMQKGLVVGQQVDYVNEFDMSEINVTTRLRRGDSLIALFASGQGELQVLCDTGQTYVWPDAFVANLPEFTAGDGGKVKIKWNAGSPTELLN